jgi:hypothetical protein
MARNEIYFFLRVNKKWKKCKSSTATATWLPRRNVTAFHSTPLNPSRHKKCRLPCGCCSSQRWGRCYKTDPRNNNVQRSDLFFEKDWKKIVPTHTWRGWVCALVRIKDGVRTVNLTHVKYCRTYFLFSFIMLTPAASNTPTPSPTLCNRTGTFSVTFFSFNAGWSRWRLPNRPDFLAGKNLAPFFDVFVALHR